VEEAEAAAAQGGRSALRAVDFQVLTAWYVIETHGFSVGLVLRNLCRPVRCVVESGSCVAIGEKGGAEEYASTGLSPLRGLLVFPLLPHGLRPFGKLRAGCGLHSFAASRLRCGYFWDKFTL
jgi:hypothetical protein